MAVASGPMPASQRQDGSGTLGSGLLGRMGPGPRNQGRFTQTHVKRYTRLYHGYLKANSYIRTNSGIEGYRQTILYQYFQRLI